jgi:hypothetical protein
VIARSTVMVAVAGFQSVEFHVFSFNVLQLLRMCFFCSQTIITCDKHFSSLNVQVLQVKRGDGK